ncbi:MAG TPA: MarR family transcriptional regulator [Ktedonobacterales bacterium]|nr:MarR family transcriptional regulator [Ktedonobacterales bacterium]
MLNTPPDPNRSAQTPTPHKADYERLAHFRYTLRVFSRQTELAAREVGLTPQQYFLLLAIKGFPGREMANITELAERLQIRHNAVIGLVNRAVERGLVEREQDPESEDRRVVQVRLTTLGAQALAALATGLRAERYDLLLALQSLEAQDAVGVADGADDVGPPGLSR